MTERSTNPARRLRSIQKLLQDGGADPGSGLATHSRFSRVLAHARDLDRLDRQLAVILDPGLASHCQVAEFRHHCLILACSQASYATRIRMIAQQLLESFTEAGESGIERIDTCIAPVNRPQPEIRQPRTLPAAAIQALGRFAADSGDVEIQAAFDRINPRREP